MLAIATAAALVVACSAIVGQGVAVLAGHGDRAWWAAGVGCCLLLAVAGVLIRAPGRGLTVVVACGVLTVAPLFSRAVRTALSQMLPDGLIVAGAALLATLLPFAVSGRAGIIGVGVNNDMSAHLTTAWWLEHRVGPKGTGAIGGALPDVGYPVGPHALADAVARVLHISLVHSFDAVIIVSAPILALVALGALGRLARPARLAAATLVGLCYLTVSYIAQSSFKEALESVVLLTALLVTLWIARAGGGWRAGLPLGAVLAGAVHIYSYPGLVWPLGVIAAVALVERAVPALLRSVPGVALVALPLLVPAIPQIADFYKSPFAGENHNGNLVHALPPVEAVGTWLASDFRFYPRPLWPSLVLAAIACVGLIVAIARLLARREAALPAALLLGVAVYLYTVATKSIYVSAKALAVIAPLVMLTLAAGLLEPRAIRGRRAGLIALAAVIGVAAFASSFLVLRDARVGPLAHGDELAILRARIGSQPTFLVGKNDFAQWDLHGTNVWVNRYFYPPAYAPTRASKPIGLFDQVDFDNFLPSTLDRFRYVIVGSTPYQSTPPPNFRRVASTRSFALWERRGRTPLRYPVDPNGAPGSVLDCSSALGRERLGGAGPRGTAGVLPRPVVLGASSWQGQARRAGDRAQATVRLPRGRWDVSLQYASSTGLEVDAPGLKRRMPATLDRIGSYYLVGTVSIERPMTLPVRVRALEMNGLAQLLGARGATRALSAPGRTGSPLGAIAFTRHGARERVVPVREACGRYVDWVAPPVTGS